MANLTFTLPSGRTIGVTSAGDPIAEKIVVFCHPAPGSSMFDPDPTETATHGVHMLAFDRPGYGSSDPLPPGHWPSIAQSADDIAAYLREMNRDESEIGVNRPKAVGVAGWSAGGRVALALAARHPDVVDRVAIIATPAPNEEVQWVDPQLQKVSDHLGTLSPDAALSQLTGMLAEQAAVVAAHDEVRDIPLDMLGESAVDAAALARPGARNRLGMMLRDAFRQGAGGVAADILSYTARPWGFEFSDVAAETLIVNGQGDPLAGNAHAAWYQRALPDARVQMMPGVGHMVVFPAWAEVLAHLVPDAVKR